MKNYFWNSVLVIISLCKIGNVQPGPHPWNVGSGGTGFLLSPGTTFLKGSQAYPSRLQRTAEPEHAPQAVGPTVASGPSNPFLFPEFNGPRFHSSSQGQNQEQNSNGCLDAAAACDIIKKMAESKKNLPLIRLKKKNTGNSDTTAKEIIKSRSKRRVPSNKRDLVVRVTRDMPLLRLRRSPKAGKQWFERLSRKSMPMVRLRRGEEVLSNKRSGEFDRVMRAAMPVMRLRKRFPNGVECLGCLFDDGEVEIPLTKKASMPLMRLKRPLNEGDAPFDRLMRSAMPMVRLKKPKNVVDERWIKVDDRLSLRSDPQMMPMVRLKREDNADVTDLQKRKTKILWPSLPTDNMVMESYVNKEENDDDETNHHTMKISRPMGGGGHIPAMSTFVRVSRSAMPMVRLKKESLEEDNWGHVLEDIGGSYEEDLEPLNGDDFARLASRPSASGDNI